LGVPLGIEPSGLIFVSGLAMSITPGKAGELLKSLMIEEITGSPLSKTLPIVVSERVMDLVALLVLGAYGALALDAARPVAIAALAGAASLLVLLSSSGLSAWTLQQLSRIPLVRRNAEALLGALASLHRLFAPAEAVLALTLSLGAWFVHGLALYYVAHAFSGVSLSLGQALLTNSAPLLAGALAMIPGGLGLTEASMTGALMAFGGHGTTQAVATAITLTVRLTTLWWAVALGVVALGLFQWRRRAFVSP
jgi:uncharacterized protein (TIRG00374 family)